MIWKIWKHWSGCKKEKTKEKKSFQKKKSQLFKTCGAGLTHSFLMLHVHNAKCFHTKDKIRISLGMKTSMISFRNHKSTRNHFQMKYFCLEKAEKIQTSLLVFTNAGFNKFLQEVLYRLFQKPNSFHVTGHLIRQWRDSFCNTNCI